MLSNVIFPLMPVTERWRKYNRDLYLSQKHGENITESHTCHKHMKIGLYSDSLLEQQSRCEPVSEPTHITVQM
jgi:hypothetical protein